MADNIKLSFTLTAKLIQEGMMATRTPPKTRGKAVKTALWTVIFLVSLYLIRLAKEFGVGFDQYLILLLGAALSVGPLALLIYLRLRNTTNSEALRQLNAGASCVTLSPHGFEIETGTGYIWTNWHGIEEIVGTKNGTALISGMSRFIFPDTALPAKLSPKQFLAQLREWKNPPS